MIWRLGIFSSIIGSMLAMFGGRANAADVSGRIQLMDISHSSSKKTTDFSDVAIWLTPTDGSVLHPVRRHARMVQQNKRFSPHIIVIGTGSIVDFPNLDPIFHNAFSNFNGQIFDVALYPPGSSRSVRFDRPGIVRVFCNIHPSMSAVIVVVNSPYFTITRHDGSFDIPDVADGDYAVHFFHERAVPDVLDRITQNIRVSGQPDNLPPVTISEAGYLPVAHKNKYGRDYPPNADDSQTYSWPLK